MQVKKILIVDDEVNNRLLLEEILEDFKEQGVEIVLAEDGKQGLDIILREKPNLVFLDIMMPEIDGYEVCNIVKKEFNLMNTYIVLLTAKGQAEDKNRGKVVLCDKYITKPFYFDEVLAIAAEVLGLKLN
ncbi:response regulator [Clostridium tagluense]|nr:response regulator [Clostridium tagluense]MCB2312520.1 response regulator [Clostridium tagluense]MCB2317213.1 response regulator [Clostridium tagluense]MCB2322077.1 response regulator [Clostridium tagluense]MCB2327162.1 response regulator [Clostridium tagluense]MCB2331862.1 response regulator [Clostridium tagluense]